MFGHTIFGMAAAVAPSIPPSLQLPTEQVRAVAAHARQHAADLAFASYFLPREKRSAVQAVAVVCRQLTDILMPKQSVTAPASNNATDDDACDLESTTDGCPTPQACEGGCQGGGESIQQRRTVCSAILEYLFAGRETKQPELDGFHAVVRHHGLTRDRFERLFDGVASLAQVHRYATWPRLRDDLEHAAGKTAGIFWNVLAGAADSSETAAHAQAKALGTAASLIHLLGRIPDDWHAGLLRLPLNDLVQAGLNDHDIGAFVEAGTTHGDVRFDAMLVTQCERARNLLRGSARAIATLPDTRSRRALAVYIALQVTRLDALQAAKGTVIARPPAHSALDRLRALPLAFRLSRDPARASGII